MKHVVYGISMFAIVTGFFLLFMVIRTKPLKEEELYHATGCAMEEALKECMKNGTNQLAAGKVFCEFLEAELGNKGELTVEVIHCDVKRGLLRVKVTLDFSYITGQKGSVTVDRTLIYEGGVPSAADL